MLKGMDIQYIFSILPDLLDSLGFTLQMALTSYIFAVLGGVIIALIRFYKVKILDKVFAVYISFFRGTPLVAQLFLLYFGISRNIPFASNDRISGNDNRSEFKYSCIYG